jgi:hypothetical protein
MAVNPRTVVVGVFNDRGMAEQALRALHDADFARDQIRYAGPGNAGNLLEDIRSLFTGPTATRDNLANDLSDMGLSDDEARYYANEYTNGRPIIAVRAPGREQEAMNILQQYGAYNYNSTFGSQQPVYAQQAQDTMPQGASPANASTAGYQREVRHEPVREQVAQQNQPQANVAGQTIRPVPSSQQQTNQQVIQSTGQGPQLQDLQAQLQTTQQQLQDARAQLQAAKEREVQLRKAKEQQNQYHTLQKQLQDAQAQLQATLAELRDTHSRINQYDQ